MTTSLYEPLILYDLEFRDFDPGVSRVVPVVSED